jgi:FkbM family methyltransferase
LGLKDSLRSFAAALIAPLLRSINRRHHALGAGEWRELGMSFSQLGEDRLVWHFLRDRRQKGIYVDVGAFDPTRYSNTLLLYKAGWRGINIDPNPDAIEAFKAARPGDTSVCAAVSDAEKRVDYLVYPGAATNRIVDAGVKENATLDASVLGETPVRRIPMTTRTLDSLLDEHVPAGTPIDFLNVDCEGEDLKVLAGLDWPRRQPLLVCVEAHGDADRDQVTGFMRERGYEVVGRMHVTLVFRRGGQP